MDISTLSECSGFWKSKHIYRVDVIHFNSSNYCYFCCSHWWGCLSNCVDILKAVKNVIFMLAQYPAWYFTVLLLIFCLLLYILNTKSPKDFQLMKVLSLHFFFFLFLLLVTAMTHSAAEVRQPLYVSMSLSLKWCWKITRPTSPSLTFFSSTITWTPASHKWRSLQPVHLKLASQSCHRVKVTESTAVNIHECLHEGCTPGVQ